MIGTIIPAGLLIVLGIIYISTGGHNHMDMSQGFFPDLSKFDNLVLAEQYLPVLRGYGDDGHRTSWT